MRHSFKPLPDIAPTPLAHRMLAIPEGVLEVAPNRRFAVAAFELDATEVTVEEYAQCVSAGICPVPEAFDGCNFGRQGREPYPVNCVEQVAADMFCKWAGERLPTSIEWEYAARGGTRRTYPWGEEPPEGRACHDRSGTQLGTCPVGAFPRGNGVLGLSDMSGNVAEWTSERQCVVPPGNYLPNELPQPVAQALVRGGAWSSDKAASVSTAGGEWVDPSISAVTIGFRCCK
jgi:formylglycine-generating enzyme required for sulfatase activity